MLYTCIYVCVRVCIYIYIYIYIYSTKNAYILIRARKVGDLEKMKEIILLSKMWISLTMLKIRINLKVFLCTE